MNLIPTLISIGLAASVSLFYLQNQKDEPNKINYRAALSEFEQSAVAFATHTPLESNNPQPQSHCQNLVSDFSAQLPADSQWTVDIAGLDCDTAVLSLNFADSDDFNNLLSAATASGRSYVTETDTSTTPSTKSIKWTQRLYTRTAADFGIRAKLKNNSTNSCLASPCRSVPVATSTVSNTPESKPPADNKTPKNDPNDNSKGQWTEGQWTKEGECSQKCGGGIQKYQCIGGTCDPDTKPSEKCNTQHCPINGGWSDWSPCSPTCGDGKKTRICNNPLPEHNGNECIRNNGAPTTREDPKETKSCKIISCPTPINGGWSDWSQCIKLCGDEIQKQSCTNPKPKNNGKRCQRTDGSYTSESNNWQIKSCNLKACNQPPNIKDQEFTMEGDAPTIFKVEADDPDSDNLTFSVRTRNLGSTEAIDPANGEFRYSRALNTNKIFSYEQAKTGTRDKTLDKFIVRVTDGEGLFAEATITMVILEINDEPSIEQSSIYPKKPLFDIPFSVQFEIKDPDYEFNDLPQGSFVFTAPESWLVCAQHGAKVGYLLISCNGTPKEMENNKFSVFIMFNDGQTSKNKTFTFETISINDL